MSDLLYDGLDGMLRTVLIGVLAYAVLVTALRVSGKRTLTKLNAFDLVVTVAFGSCLATILLSKDVALAEGATALVLLVALQFVVAKLTVLSPRFGKLVKSAPRALVIDGRLDETAMREERVARDEIMAAIRSQGHGGLDLIAAVVLESDASLSVITTSAQGDRTALDPVRGVPASRSG
jgi:uncharacterized membrane protein YcaP (DUF421 family)